MRWRELKLDSDDFPLSNLWSVGFSPSNCTTPPFSQRSSLVQITMFKRPHTTKTSAPPKSSVGRKLRDQLLVNFPHLSPTQAKELLPEGFLVMKATSHLGEPVTIYLAADSGNPLFFRIGTSSATDQDDLLVPTCYAFDLVPDLLPILITAPQVVPNLVSGAGE